MEYSFRRTRRRKRTKAKKARDATSKKTAKKLEAAKRLEEQRERVVLETVASITKPADSESRERAVTELKHATALGEGTRKEKPEVRFLCCCAAAGCIRFVLQSIGGAWETPKSTQVFKNCNQQ